MANNNFLAAFREAIKENETRNAEILVSEDKLPLYSYQQTGVDFLINHRRCILADEMGLGKTIQALGAIKELDPDKTGRFIISSPKGAKFVWKQEITKWLKEDVEFCDAKDGQLENGMKFLRPQKRFTVCNHEMLREFAPYIMQNPWHGFVIDEAHRFRNKETGIRKALKELTRHYHMTPFFFITGTPLINTPRDLWSLLNLIDGYRFPHEKLFLNAWFYRRGNGDGARTFVHKNSARFQEFMEEFMIRRLRKDVVDLPPVQKFDTPIELEGDQKRIYISMRDAMLAELNDKEAVLAPGFLAQIIRLKQICLAPAMITGADSCDGIKTEVLMEAIEEQLDNEKKTVVCSQFVKYIRPLKKEIEKKFGIRVGMITGETPDNGPESREIQVDTFQEDNFDMPVMLLTDAGGEGITLTKANHFIQMDLFWTPAKNDQIFGRVYRIGQEQKVIRDYYKALNTVEQFIEELLGVKRNMFEQSVPVSLVKKLLLGRD